MDHLESYRLFALSAPDLPVFMQPWYLDAVCGDEPWSAVTVQQGGKTVAAMPFWERKKLFWRHIVMPPLCKFMGPYLLPEYRSHDDEIRLYEALIEQLPRGLAAFEQDMNYLVTNWLPFYWRGFRQTTRYSYRISLLPPEEDIFNRISRNYRSKIRAAQDKLAITHAHPVGELKRLLDLSFARQGLEAPLSTAFFKRYYAALSEKNCCRLFFAEDGAGAVHSAAMLIWDRQSAYFILSGDDPKLRASGSALLLKWAAIRYAKHELQLPVFDFEGSMIRALETGRRDFGAVQMPYFRIQKEWSPIWKWRKR